MDKKPEQRYKFPMRIPFIYSAAAATLFTIVAIDIGIQHLAVASHDSHSDGLNVKNAINLKPDPSAQPIVIARFAKNDATFASQAPDQTFHCVGEAFSSDSDLCGPLPILTSKTAPATLPKWNVPKVPLKFIWQQQVQDGRNLVVELSDNSGPLKGRTESFRNGDKTSIVITPNSDLASGDVFLAANLYAADGKRLENWVLTIAIKK